MEMPILHKQLIHLFSKLSLKCSKDNIINAYFPGALVLSLNITVCLKF